MTTPTLRAIDPHAPQAAHHEGEGVPVSVRIRERIKAAEKRFHANDNAAEFSEPGE